jgi:hypothetical protein
MKYFFHRTDGTKSFADNSGTIYANDADALDEAEKLAKNLGGNPDYFNFSIVVVGEDGLEVARVAVR